MPLARGRRPLKRWRWVGAFSEDAMACAARVSVGGVPVAWWAVWDGERLHERTHRRAGPVRMQPGRVRTAGLDLSFDEGPAVEAVSPHGEQYIWTAKQGGIPVRGTLLGRPFEDVGRMTPEQWTATYGPFADDGRPFDLDDLPTTEAIRRGRPAHAVFKIRSSRGVEHVIESSAFPIVASEEGTSGAMILFWPLGEDGEGGAG